MKTKTLPTDSLILYCNSISLSQLEPQAGGGMRGVCKLDGGFCVNGKWDKPVDRPDIGIPLVSETVPVMEMIHELALAVGKTNDEMVAAFGVAVEAVLAAKGAIPPAPPKI